MSKDRPKRPDHLLPRASNPRLTPSSPCLASGLPVYVRACQSLPFVRRRSSCSREMSSSLAGTMHFLRDSYRTVFVAFYPFACSKVEWHAWNAHVSSTSSMTTCREVSWTSAYVACATRPSLVLQKPVGRGNRELSLHWPVEESAFAPPR